MVADSPPVDQINSSASVANMITKVQIVVIHSAHLSDLVV